MPVELGEQYLRLLAHHAFNAAERRQIVEDLGLEPGDRVLDLGCGIGLWAGWLAEKVALDGRVAGMDVSRASIIMARERTRSDSHNDVLEYTVVDARAIPFGSGSFDLLFCANTLGYLADPRRYLREMKRVVRRGGRVAVKDIDAGHMVLHPVRPELMAQIILSMTKLVEHRCSYLDQYAGRVLDFFVGRKLHSYFQRVGFERVETRSYTIERTQPLEWVARQHLKGLGEFWLSELVPFLTAGHLAELQELFDERSERFLLGRPDFYYFDAETLTTGTV